MKFIETVLKSKFARVFPFVPVFHLFFPVLYFFAGIKRHDIGRKVLYLCVFVIGTFFLYRLVPDSLDILVSYAALSAVAWYTQSRLQEISSSTWIAKKPFLLRRLLMICGIFLILCIILVSIFISTGISRRTDHMLLALETKDESLWTAQLHPMMRKTNGNLEAFEEQIDLSIDLTGEINRIIPIGLHVSSSNGKTLLTVTYLATISGDGYFLRVSYLKNSSGEGISSIQFIPR